MQLRLICTLALLVCTAFANVVKAQQNAVNLVANPSFETGDFTGWTQGSLQYTSVVHNHAEAGAYAAQLLQFNPGTLSQNLTTTPGGFYNLNFYLEPGDIATFVTEPSAALTANPEIQAYFDGNLVYDTATAGLPGSGSSSSGYSLISLNNLRATTGSTALSFVFVNSMQFYYLDAVSVTAVPEPSSPCLVAVGVLAGLGVWRVSRRRAVTA